MSTENQVKKDFWMKELGSKDRTAQGQAIQELAIIGEVAVPGLLELLEKGEWQVRNQAAVALGAIGPPAASATSALMAALQDVDKYLRGHAAASLGQIGRDAKAVVPALTNALKDKEEDVRRNAAVALGCFGPVAKDAFSAPTELLNDEHRVVRKQAARSLKAIDAKAAAPYFSLWSCLSRWFGGKTSVRVTRS